MYELEHAAMAAWPALEEATLGSWRLRHAEGYTWRANSANALAADAALTAAEVAAIAAYYHRRELPPIFRLTSLANDDHADALLHGLGYVHKDPSLVMTRSLDDALPAEPCERLPDPVAWLTAFQQVTGRTDAGQGTHLRMLQAIATPVGYGVIYEQDRPVCGGLAVCHGEWVGLFNVATAEDQRGRGLASRLCEGLMAWGRQHGVQGAFLQVMSNNQAAIRLYEKLGFGERYRYWYRVGGSV